MSFSRYIWDFSDGSGTTIADQSGNGVDFTSDNDPLQNAGFWTDVDGAGTWSGSDETFSVNVKYKADFQPLQAGYTFVWMRANFAVGGPGTSTVLGINAGTQADAAERHRFQLRTAGNQLYMQVHDAGGSTTVEQSISGAGVNDGSTHNYAVLYHPDYNSATPGYAGYIDHAKDGTIGTRKVTTDIPDLVVTDDSHALNLGAKGDGVDPTDNVTIYTIEWYYHSSHEPNFAQLVAWKELHPNMAISQDLWEGGEDASLDTPKTGLTLVKHWDFGAKSGNRNFYTRGETTEQEIHNVEDLERDFYTQPIHLKTVINNEWQEYMTPSEGHNVHVFNEQSLSLTARLNPTMTEGDIASGYIRTKMLYKYGYFEIRCKSPTGRGIWPAFWTIEGKHSEGPAEHNPNYAQWPPEIDFLEIVHSSTQDTTHIHHNLIGPETSQNGTVKYERCTDFSDYVPGFDFADDFHVIGCLWEPDRVSWYVDGVRTRTTQWNGGWIHPAASGSAVAREGTIIVNLAIGGNYPGDPTDSGIFPCSLDIDYIKIWQGTDGTSKLEYTS